MNSVPLLSIVVAVYNGEKFLNAFFSCIQEQHLASFEIIMVNDGSTDSSAAILEQWKERFSQLKIINQPNQGVSVARNTGLAQATGKYLAFPDIDDRLYPEMYGTLLSMAEEHQLDVATCNGRYVYEDQRNSQPIFPPNRLPSTQVIKGHIWLEMALNSRKFLHVTWLNIYRREFITQHGFTFEPGLRHQDIPWTTEVLLAAERVQYTEKQVYDYYIHSASISHKPDTDDTRIRSAQHYMKILEMLDTINHRYTHKTRRIKACRWQIAKEGLGIIHTIDQIQDRNKQKALIMELFNRGIWGLIWRNAQDLRLRWRLGRRYIRLKMKMAA